MEITFNDAVKKNKEYLKMALDGMLPTENGYRKASKEECNEFIMTIYENISKEAKIAKHSVRAYEKLIEDSGIPYDLAMYFQALRETKMIGDEDET